jgi:hypothetical protein
MKKIYRRLVLSLMQSRLYSWALLHVIPYIRFTTYYTSLRGWKYQRGYRLLQAGDILLTIDRKKLTTVLIPGEFSHAALCVDKGSEFEIAEMTHSHFTRSTFFDICKESDRVVILRCKTFDYPYIQKVVEKCLSFSEASYDIGFELGIQSLYCSELVYQSDFERRIGADLTDLAGLGRPYISPTGLRQADNVEVVWDSDLEVKAQ